MCQATKLDNAFISSLPLAFTFIGFNYWRMLCATWVELLSPVCARQGGVEVNPMAVLLQVRREDRGNGMHACSDWKATMNIAIQWWRLKCSTWRGVRVLWTPWKRLGFPPDAPHRERSPSTPGFQCWLCRCWLRDYQKIWSEVTFCNTQVEADHMCNRTHSCRSGGPCTKPVMFIQWFPDATPTFKRIDKSFSFSSKKVFYEEVRWRES